MESVILKRCLLLSTGLHVLLCLLLVLGVLRARPRAVGLVDVSILPLPGAALADGRKPGSPTGSPQPAGPQAHSPVPKGTPLLSQRPRTRTSRVLPPRRDAIASRVDTRVKAGHVERTRPQNQPLHEKDTAQIPPDAATGESGPMAGGAAPDGTILEPGAIAASPAGAGDPAGDSEQEEVQAAALGIPDSPDAHLAPQPAPDFDTGLPTQQAVPGATHVAGANGIGLPVGARGTGGATRNRGFLGGGLMGAYYADAPRKAGDYPLNTPYVFPTFTRLVLQRVDPSINFSWDMTPPAPELPATYFSIRWTGKLLVPATDTYIFYLERLDDGGRLFINGEKVAESWMIQQGISVVRALPLQAGVHDIRVDYCQGPETHASVRLSWSSSQFGKEVIRAQAPVAPTQVVAGMPKP